MTIGGFSTLQLVIMYLAPVAVFAAVWALTRINKD